MAQMSRVVFSPNVPQQLAVVDPTGDFVAEPWGDRVHYETTDGRILDVNMDLAADINLLDLRPGEPFCIVKRHIGRNPIQWEVWRTGDSEKRRAAEEQPEILEQLRESVYQARERKQREARGKAGASGISHGSARAAFLPNRTEVDGRGKPTTDQKDNAGRKPIAIAERPAAEQPAMAHFPWCQFLLSQSQALIDVMAAAVTYSGERYGATVRPEDVRALVITTFINIRQNGGANAA